jgi:hypothetical protein
MDPYQLGEAFAVVAIAVVVVRGVLPPVGAAGDMLAGLFAPYDGSLGWPHGVQEGDEPWGWRPGRPPEPEVFDGPDALNDDLGGRSRGPGPLEAALAPRSGTLVVPVARVTRVRLGPRPR